MQVIAMIHEENGLYGVSFPDFPGATTVADDLETAVAKAAEMLAFHVEGLAEDGPVPQVRSLAELNRDPEFREDSKGAVLALVPYTPPSRAVRLNITIEESLLERIDRAAESVGETRSGFLAEAAKQRMMLERINRTVKSGEPYSNKLVRNARPGGFEEASEATPAKRVSNRKPAKRRV